MSNASLALVAATALVVAGATPGMAQGQPIRHMLIQYRPASGDYCTDTVSRDAILHPSEVRCESEPGWGQQRAVMARR